MEREFQALAKTLLERATEVLPQWLPGGHVRGGEYICSDLRGGSGESLKVNIRTGVWKDFASNEKGGNDLVALYAAINNCEQSEAFDRLASTYGFTPAAVVPKRDPVRSVAPPYGAPDPDFIHRDYGEAKMAWVYRDKDGNRLFYVARYEPAGGKKQIVPWTWGQQTEQWVARAWSAPRPLYQLDRLTAEPTKAVLVVEGEKAADAAQKIVGCAYIVTTWSGGSQAIEKTDWSPLKGRRVLLWPDADNSARFPGTDEIKPYEQQPGPYAMAQVGNKLEDTLETKIIDVRDRTVDGWDAADALAEGMDMAALVAWAKPRATPFIRTAQEVIAKSKDGRAVAGARAISNVQVNVLTEEQFPVDGSMYGLWEKLGVICGNNGLPIMNLMNVLQVLENHPQFKDAIWYDEFHKRYFTGDPKREWSDADTLELTNWMQQNICFRRIGKETVADAVTAFANRRRKNEPLDWMRSLKWDGEERIAHVFEDCFGSPESDHVKAASRNFFISMVARVHSPGCKVDNVVVLEGPQGNGKSTALQVIGGDWYTEAHESVTSNDFFMVLHGKMLVEIAELDSFNRAEVTRIKQVITSKTDRFRAPYARTAQDHPRMSVFVGTTNERAYLRDATGGRRFWPIKTGEIKHELLTKNREQYFAEAVHRYLAHEGWWGMPAETSTEQEDRRRHDEWEPVIGKWLDEHPQILDISTEDVARDPLGIAIGQLNPIDQRRIGGVFTALGWTAVRVNQGGRRRPLWRRPSLMPSAHSNN